MNKTLTEGSFGVILGGLRKSADLLRKIPAVDQLFNTKYIGAVAQGLTEVGLEVGGATAIPAAIEGRLPTKEDVARAAALIPGILDRREVAQKKIHDMLEIIETGEANFRKSLGIDARAPGKSGKVAPPIPPPDPLAHIPTPDGLTPSQQQVYREAYQKQQQKMQQEMQKKVKPK